jgi:hypothetical protein
MPLLFALLLNMVPHNMCAFLAGGRVRIDEVVAGGLALCRIIALLPLELEILEVFAGAPWGNEMLGIS